MPRLPLAPVLFSTKTCWPSVRDKYSPSTRAATSVEPPAGNGTMKRTGRVGHSCAQTCTGARISASNAIKTRRLVIGKAPALEHDPEKHVPRSGMDTGFRKRSCSPHNLSATDYRIEPAPERPVEPA